MAGADRSRERRLVQNLPYDESVELQDSEEVPSVSSPTPRGERKVRRVLPSSGGRPPASVHTVPQREVREDTGSNPHQQTRSGGRSRGRGLMSAAGSSDESEEEEEEEPRPQRVPEAAGARPGGGADREEEEDEEEDEEEEEESDEDESDEEETGSAVEGAYDPADYANLPVGAEVKELFQYITRYTPQTLELEHSLRPFIPDFIPAVGDIDAFLKVPRPDGVADSLGLLVLDEPSVKQSDPTVLSLWLSEESKQHAAAELKKVTSVPSPRSNPRVLDQWVESIGALHRSKPPASVQYARPMPDIDSLMQEWPAEVEELLGRARPPGAALACDLPRYAQLLCALLDIPVYCSRVQSLHLLFSLYLEFRDSQHFTRAARP